MLFDPEIEFTEELEAAIEFYRGLVADANSNVPGSIGMDVRVEVMESRKALQDALYIITKEQLWDEQIDEFGNKLPRYKPDTIRKKQKIVAEPPHTPDKLVNYTLRWSSNLYNNGIYIYVDAAQDLYRFEYLPPYDSWPVNKYLRDEYIHMTDENFEIYEARMSRLVDRMAMNRVNWEIEASQYAEIIQGLKFIGYDFGV